MSADELKRLLQARPFKSFKVFLPSDRAFEVPHPEFAWLTPNGRTLVVGEATSDGFDILDVPLIVRVQVSPAPSKEG